MLFKAEFTQTNELSHEKLLTSEPFLDTSAEATSTVVANANCGNIETGDKEGDELFRPSM